MAAPLPYRNTIPDAARESGRSERELSRAATGRPAALSLNKTGRVPSVKRVRLLCAALDLEFYIGPPREGAKSTPRPRELPPNGDRKSAVKDRPPPRVEALRAGIREDLACRLGTPPGRRPDDGLGEDSARQLKAPATRHVEIRQIATGPDRHPRTHGAAPAPGGRHRLLYPPWIRGGACRRTAGGCPSRR